MRKYELTEQELFELVESSQELQLLYENGLDGWEWWTEVPLPAEHKVWAEVESYGEIDD